MASKTEKVVFNGRPYRRYPDSPRRSDRVYFRCTSPPGQPHRYLHRDIYEHHFGPIPDGWHVHHKDEDPLNNDPSNLEPLPPLDHAGEHWTPERAEWARQHMDEIRDLTKAWHGSPEGLDWHRKHGHHTWNVVAQSRDYECDQCGDPFSAKTLQSDVRFCSNKCKSAWRRAAGLDDVDRTCAYCGGALRVNKYSKTQNCSRVCAQRHRRGLQPDG